MDIIDFFIKNKKELYNNESAKVINLLNIIESNIYNFSEIYNQLNKDNYNEIINSINDKYNSNKDLLKEKHIINLKNLQIELLSQNEVSKLDENIELLIKIYSLFPELKSYTEITRAKWISDDKIEISVYNNDFYRFLFEYKNKIFKLLIKQRIDGDNSLYYTIYTHFNSYLDICNFLNSIHYNIIASKLNPDNWQVIIDNKFNFKVTNEYILFDLDGLINFIKNIK